jgi:hypothetical protein
VPEETLPAGPLSGFTGQRFTVQGLARQGLNVVSFTMNPEPDDLALLPEP